MDRVETFLGPALFNFLLSPIGFFLVLLLGRAVLFTALEQIWPTRTVARHAVVFNDLAASVAYSFIVFPLAAKMSRFVPGYHHLFPAAVCETPLYIRLILYLILTDFGHYWIHRLMHTKHVWRVHKWHHSPRYMYWLGGVRATIPQQFLVNIPYVIALPLLDISPWWFGVVLAVFNAVQNDWMHMNVSWRSWRLEWIFVTPRYHHIHHSADPNHYLANLANLFSFWDRLFGTYLDPDSVGSGLTFGIGARESPIRLISGI
jgi:sterol desaturase/sphingolipid hydroxylase (fatty acid hydroxylase superfamily)